MLKISGTQYSAETPCLVDIDWHVPISFRTSKSPVGGARYLALGERNKQLLELKIAPDSLALIGFSLVLADTMSEESLDGDGPVEAGLPILDSTEELDLASMGGGRRSKSQTSVTLSCNKDYAEIRLGRENLFTSSIAHGRVRFLLKNDHLIGLRVLSLTDEERQILNDYVQRRG